MTNEIDTTCVQLGLAQVVLQKEFLRFPDVAKKETTKVRKKRLRANSETHKLLISLLKV